jgi:putative two-component system response regulator
MRNGHAGRILIVDDEASNVAMISRLLIKSGYEVSAAANGEAALAQVHVVNPDVILLDVNMPLLDGFEVCRRLKTDSATRLIPIVLITGLAALEDRVRGIDAGADDFLTKPFATAELTARVGSLTRLKRYTDELESAEVVIMSLARIIEARDPYTGGHCDRLGVYAAALGARLDLTGGELVALRRGGVLHDVGKIAVPDAVLLKPGPLNPAERTLMEAHPVTGEQLCGGLRLLEDVCPIVRHHHERRDGSGYPDGLSGDRIPLLAQILSVADTYDAITTDRPYRAAASIEHACAELRADVDRGWKSAALVEQFAELASHF